MAKMEEIPVEMLAQCMLMKDTPWTDWSIVVSSCTDSDSVSVCTDKSASSAMKIGEEGVEGADPGIPCLATWLPYGSGR